MSPPVKTTVYLSASDYRRLKALAEIRDNSAAALIREAIAEYVRRHAVPARPRSIGAFHGDEDLSTRTEELLDGFGDDRR